MKSVDDWFAKYKLVPVDEDMTCLLIAEVQQDAYIAGVKDGEENMKRLMEAAGVLEPTP